MPSEEVAEWFKFDMDNYVVLAAVLLKLDKNLGVKRHNLVPDLIEEDDFWRNYFYKIALFKRDLLK